MDSRPFPVIVPTLSEEVRAALEGGKPVVALESTVISHGLPYPQNLELAARCESVIREEGAIPATIGIISGEIMVGLSRAHLETLASAKNVRKVSRRDFGIAIARKEHGGTTVAGTLMAAEMAGIRVFATGGIGGVHRGDGSDVSADLPELARASVVVVCAGAKSILDLPRTLEWLETAGVTVLGYGTPYFPAFYAVSSGLKADAQVDSADEIAAIARARWGAGINGGVLVTVPPPDAVALPLEAMERAIEAALEAARQQGVTGKDSTPFLLEQVSALTGGKSMAVNLALLEQNARIGARIAVAMVTGAGL